MRSANSYSMEPYQHLRPRRWPFKRWAATMRCIFCWIAALVWAAPLLAQSDSALPYQFSPQAHAIVQRLSSFAALDASDGPARNGLSG